MDDQLGNEAAAAFNIILSECDNALCVSMHCNVRLMYRQRFFLETSPSLVEGFHKASKGQRDLHLIFLCMLFNM